MAGTPIAYSEITILDLIDTATYIYYAKDENGTGATIAPGAETKYIGIYSGPPFEGGQPQTPPVETEWSKYVGDKGDKGEKGEKGDGALLVKSNVSELYFFHSLNSQNSETREGNVTSLRIELFRIPKNEESKIELKEENCSFVCTNSDLSESFSQYYEIINNEQDTGDKGTLVFYFQKFLTDKTSILDKQSWENPIAFVFSYKENEEIQCVKVFDFRPGVSADMAKFNITATNINAAVNNTKMKFSKDGLSIYGAGFSIYDNTEEDNVKVLSMDNSGKLSLKKIVAESGTIGGFTIKKGIEENQEYDRLVSSNNGIILDGKNNNIIAETIELGTGAKIWDYLLLGEAKIQNPMDPNFLIDLQKAGLSLQWIQGVANQIDGKNLEVGAGMDMTDFLAGTQVTAAKAELLSQYLLSRDYKVVWTQTGEDENGLPFFEGTVEKLDANDLDSSDNRPFIEAKGIKIFDNGNAKFGKISIDGNNSKIFGNSFSITPSEASFSNVTVSGKIKTAIFEQGSVQTAGGMILVRPATRILVDGSAYKLENSTGFNNGDYCEINGNSCIINFKKGSNNCTFSPIDKNATDLGFKFENGATIVSYGQDGNVGISINSSANDADFPSEAITIFEVGADANFNDITKTPRIILGDLGQSGKNYGGLTGYGLYAENAYLHGALVTEFKDDETYYSGFNGKRPAKLEGSEDSEDPYVLLWAGAKKDKSTDNYDVDNAPFRVDSEGNLFASKATFEGSVISKSTIEATEIVTATLRGKEDQAALTICDKSGIEFKTTDSTTFSINSSGLVRGESNFISISDSNVSFSTGLSTLTENRLEWGNNNHGISYDNNIIEMGQVTKNLAKAEGQSAASTPAIIKMQAKEIMIGPKMRYEPKSGGCDLYVL